MSKIVVTEEMHPEKEWFAQARNMSMEDLPVFVNHVMNNYVHDYGTACHAVSACAIAAAWASCKAVGLTGFQAGFVMWDFIRHWYKTSNETGMRLIDFDNMLYPQYAHRFDKVIGKDTWECIQQTAEKRLKEYEEKQEPVSIRVLEHWKSIVRGEVPFGYEVVEDVI